MELSGKQQRNQLPVDMNMTQDALGANSGGEILAAGMLPRGGGAGEQRALSVLPRR
jgi:hypothetical protein